MINSSIIPDSTEVSEVNEEAKKSSRKQLEKEESEKEELGTKGDRDDEVVYIYMYVLVWMQRIKYIQFKLWQVALLISPKLLPFLGRKPPPLKYILGSILRYSNFSTLY